MPDPGPNPNLAPVIGNHVVSAQPTKRFFMVMLVKDITLDDAIIDLVDNSVDAAHEHFNANINSAEIKLTVSDSQFFITDNCGGISLDRAKNYAFRFGRDDKDSEAFDADKTIGQFGVGMKRAIFKFGSLATVTSFTEQDAYKVKVDVEEWRKSPNPEWTFPYEDLDREPNQAIGTTLEVTQLFQLVKSEFANPVFIDDLSQKIRRAHYRALNNGVKIYLNEQQLPPFEIDVVESNQLKPIHRVHDLGNGVSLDVVAGIADSSPKEAGWYVFCADRMVMAADQSAMTGWGDSTLVASAPRYHNQFSRFRGVARFEASDKSKLPWNTTKRGVDASDPTYQKGKQYMIDSLKAVVRFLNDLDRELDQESTPLRDLVDDAVKSSMTAFDNTSQSDVFVYPKSSPNKTHANISFKVDIDRFTSLKEELGINNARDLGSYCFDFTFEKIVGVAD